MSNKIYDGYLFFWNGKSIKFTMIKLQNPLTISRLILLECPPSYQDLAQSFPGHDSLLPSNLHRCSSLLAETLIHIKTPTLNDIHASNVSCFGRQIQATSLLDHVVQATSLPRTPSFSELRALDDRLREFCTIMMGQSVHGHQCDASGIVIRYYIYSRWTK